MAVRGHLADHWPGPGLVFTTLAGTAFEPRNFNRRLETRCARAGVRPQIDVTMNVYTEVSDAKTLQALRRLAKQLGP